MAIAPGVVGGAGAVQWHVNVPWRSELLATPPRWPSLVTFVGTSLIFSLIICLVLRTLPRSVTSAGTVRECVGRPGVDPSGAGFTSTPAIGPGVGSFIARVGAVARRYGAHWSWTSDEPSMQVLIHAVGAVVSLVIAAVFLCWPRTFACIAAAMVLCGFGGDCFAQTDLLHPLGDVGSAQRRRSQRREVSRGKRQSDRLFVVATRDNR